MRVQLGDTHCLDPSYRKKMIKKFRQSMPRTERIRMYSKIFGRKEFLLVVGEKNANDWWILDTQNDALPV